MVRLCINIRNVQLEEVVTIFKVRHNRIMCADGADIGTSIVSMYLYYKYTNAFPRLTNN